MFQMEIWVFKHEHKKNHSYINYKTSSSNDPYQIDIEIDQT